MNRESNPLYERRWDTVLQDWNRPLDAAFPAADRTQ
jgi:hypothetical protein